MHLYIHVPFCARRCSYCDFAIAVRRVVPSERFAEVIAREWALRRSAPFGVATSPIETIYFGGGTPSRLAPEMIGRILDLIRRDSPTASDAEITLEANPDDVTATTSMAWAAAGVNRVSLGAQSFDPGVLAWMHRTHRADQVAPAMDLLRRAGITNLSLDLIFALPSELGRGWGRDLDAALALDPTHLSLYGLTVEPRTPLGRWTERGEAFPASEGAYAEEFLHTTRMLAAAGWDHYEVSNASRPGFRSRHNSAYWRRASFTGLGPAAHSGSGSDRHWNIRDWEPYARAVEAGRSAIEGSERLSPAAIRMEDLYLRLRTREGAPRDAIPAAEREAWIREDWAREVGDRLELTPEGWLRLDALVARVA